MTENKPKIKISHFHAYNGIRLTVAAAPYSEEAVKTFDLEPGAYGVGIALCAKKDTGSRKRGKEIAVARCQKEIDGNWTSLNGKALFDNLDQVKAVIKKLRLIEKTCGESKKMKAYTDLFKSGSPFALDE